VKALIVLPSYNEKENIVQLIQAILALDPGYAVCVVDDNSPDGTAEVIRQFQQNTLPPADQGRVHLIVRAKKDGRGGAVRTGLEWGLGLPADQIPDAFVEMDCDFSHPPADLPRGLALLQDADVAMGCRYPDGVVVGWPASRRVFSFCANLLARALISWRIADYTNGYRFYSRRAAALTCQAPQRHKGYIYLSETIVEFLKARMTIRCFPIRFVNRQRGVSNTGLREIRSALFGLFEIAWLYHFGSRKAQA